jgi:hypothetical protein
VIVVVLLVASGVGAALGAQSLAEIAEREKQRRAALQKGGGTSKSFSDESLQKPPEGWRTFKDAKLGFQVSLPTAPERLDEADIVGTTRIPRVRFVARDGVDTFSVIVKERPKEPGVGSGSMLSRMQTEARLDLGGQVSGVALREVVLGLPSADFSVTSQQGGRDKSVTCRAFVGSRYLYLLMADCCAVAPAEGAVLPTATFLDSFALVEPPRP